MTADNEAIVLGLIRRQCGGLHAQVIALNGMPDYIHLLVILPTTLCIADFMEQVKGASVRGCNDVHLLAASAFKWQGGCSYNTVSASHVARMSAYIERQKLHHSKGKLWPSSELPHRDAP